MSAAAKRLVPGLLLALAGCAQPPPIAYPGPVLGFDNALVTGQSPAGTWDTAGGRQAYEPPGSLPPGAEGLGRRVVPASP